MGLKHSKYKNTGLLFELLVRQVTDDNINARQSPATNILQKYFSNTELMKEYILYQTIITSKNLTEVKSDILLNSVLTSYGKLDSKKLKDQKYNLVKEIKSKYNEEHFFKTEVPSYRLNASIYSLLELNSNQISTNPKLLTTIKSNLIEHLTQKDVQDDDTEWASLDKGTRNLAFKIMVENFNSTFEHLPDNQKNILREYVKCISTPNSMRTVLNQTLLEIKRELITQYGGVTDLSTKGKLKEVINKIVPFKKDSLIKDKDVITTLQYCELISELKGVNDSK